MRFVKLLALQILIFAFFFAISCGKSSGDQSTKPVPIGTTGCPYGSWVATNYSDRLTITQDGSIVVDQNAGHCISNGSIICNGSQFTMEIQTAENTTSHDCQPVGTFDCAFSSAGIVFTVFCPENVQDNKFNPAKEYQSYQF
jgi:hypothetical protein